MLTLAGPTFAQSLTPAFTYQGQLKNAGSPASGPHVMTFQLHDALSGGGPIGAALVFDGLSGNPPPVQVNDGLFTVSLDFGAAAFNGQRRWLEITVAGTPLSPRQELTAAPYALRAGQNWALNGDAGTTPGTHFLGTSDNQPLELRVNGQRALRLEPRVNSPNVIGGHSGNTVFAGVVGATIGGGGATLGNANQVSDMFGTVGGGSSNQAGNSSGTVDDRPHATVAGGLGNAAEGSYSTVGGGADNTASGEVSIVGGGAFNIASGYASSVGGGTSNAASGLGATVPGGDLNAAAGDFSFAAGRRAKANHQGSFVWGDSTNADFASTATNQFLIRASGGVGIGTNTPNPTFGLHIESQGHGIYVKTPVTTATLNAISAECAATNGSGVSGRASSPTGTNYGVFGSSASNNGGRGVFGWATSTTGTSYGVYGRTDSPDGYAGYFSGGRNYFGGNVGIGTTDPSSRLHVQTATTGRAIFASNSGVGGTGVFGEATAASGTTYGLHGVSSSTSGRGVFGEATAATGTTYGVCGESSSTTGRGLFGSATAATGSTNGVRGESSSTTGRGVFGWANAATGITYGVRGDSDSTSGRGVYGFVGAATGTTHGVFGESASSDGRGVLGVGNFGVYGQSAGTSGRGVFGEATATTGTNYGGRFHAAGTTARGVFSQASSTTGVNFGGVFESLSTEGRGVYGAAVPTTGVTYGVYGVNNSANASAYAVWAQGRSGASGTKSFRIDHPADPENKYLLHYSTESPEVLNAYSGTIALDAAGQAIVELPSYFTRINKDPRYTLTAVGAPMPNLHVAEEIDDAALAAGADAAPGTAAPFCWFRIAGGKPWARVSWRVEAVRNDRWVRERGAPVEVEKEGIEKGTYQHPEFYGQPAEKGMNYEATRQRREADPSDAASAPAAE